MALLTEKGLASDLGISPWTVRSWRLKGNLPCIRVGRRIFYRMESVMQWIEDQENARTVPRDCCTAIIQ